MKTVPSLRPAIIAVLFSLAIAPGEARESQALSGTWQIAFDRGNTGREASWHKHEVFSKLENLHPIQVPSCWEEIEKDYEGVAFYGTRFTTPADWNGKAVRLHFDAVNFRAEVWLNDVAVGVHEGGFTPFEFQVDDLLRFDQENSLILRVAGPILLRDKQIDGVGPMETTQWRGAITGGIWQPVRLLASGDAYVNDVFIEPKLADSSATFHLTLDQTGRETVPSEVEITIRPTNQPDTTVARFTDSFLMKPGRHWQTCNLQIPDAISWSPDHPHLYSAVVSVKLDGKISDSWTARFGMREFTIRDKQFFLNGKPLYLKATFFEGLYPVKLAYPDSREMAVREIQLAKDAGFNMIRPWRKPPPPMWLDLADEMGVLTVGSIAVECMDLPVESANLPGWVENEVRESILRDRNRACVVQWELFNELKRPVLMRMLHPMAMMARELDPTRLILDESGGWAQGANMYLPYASEPFKFNDIHDYPGPQINEEVYEKLLLTGSITHEEMRKRGLQGRLPGKNVVPGLMTYFSELGYGSLPDLEDNNRRFAECGNPIVPPTVYHQRLAEEHRQALNESGFDKIYPDLQRFCLDQQEIHGAANRRMIEAVRCNPSVKGYCIHALTAGNWIIGAGLLDLFRNPKTYAYEGTKAANQPRILSIRVRPRNVYAERGTKIEVTSVNELEALDGTLAVQIVAADGRVIFTKSVDAGLAPGITQLFGERIETAALEGTYTVKAVVTAADGSLLVKGDYSFDAFSSRQLVPPQNPIAILDPANALRPFLKQRGMPFLEFTPEVDPALPVFVSRTEAKTAEQRKRFEDITNFVRAGGTAVYLGGGGRNAPWGVGGKTSPLLPVSARTRQAIGTWNGVPHLVKEHPVFAGLPVNGLMREIYENVWAPITLVDLGGETVAGTIAYDWFPDYDLSKRHYAGPGATFWGADLAVVPLEKGRCIVSQLRIVENLGKDPVADRILFNLIKFSAR